MERSGEVNGEGFSAVVVTPTYNNARTVIGVLNRVIASGLGVIVVNDGSTDGTGELLEQWSRGKEGVRVLAHERNRGKAAALHSGFAAAEEMGFTHVVTIDTDGQLDPEQIPEFVAAARSNPRALVLGCRDAGKADYPARSLVGRRISNFAIRVECGVKVEDSQCGLRVYPLELVRAARCRARFFAFEAEVITRGVWAGFDVVEVEARCRYLPAGQRVSHFKPWIDTVRGIGVHVALLLSALPYRLAPSRRDGCCPHPCPLPEYRERGSD